MLKRARGWYWSNDADPSLGDGPFETFEAVCAAIELDIDGESQEACIAEAAAYDVTIEWVE